MARRRRHSRHHSRSKGVGHYINKLVTPVLFTGAFVSQITAKDIATSSTYATLPPMERAKFLANSVVGRTSGINLFPQYGQQKLTINPSGMVNKFTGLGLGLMIFGHIAPKGIGGKGLAKKGGKALFWGGILGGLFDDPVPRHPNMYHGVGSGNSSVQTGQMLA